MAKVCQEMVEDIISSLSSIKFENEFNLLKFVWHKTEEAGWGPKLVLAANEKTTTVPIHYKTDGRRTKNRPMTMSELSSISTAETTETEPSCNYFGTTQMESARTLDDTSKNLMNASRK